MNTHDVISQQPPLPPPRKPRFIEICMDCKLGNDNFPAFADLAGVPVATIERMFIGEPVKYYEAQKVLDWLSVTLKQDLTFHTVDIPLLLPTFSDLVTFHHCALTALALQARVDETVITSMYLNRSVSRQNVVKVLLALSRRTGCTYTLNNVAVNIIEEAERA